MNEKIEILEVLKAELKAEGVKVAYIKKTYSEHPRLQIMLPLGRAMHVFVVEGKLLLSEGGACYKADKVMDLAVPGNDPQAVVDMFKELLQTQMKFLNKFSKLHWADARKLDLLARGIV